MTLLDLLRKHWYAHVVARTDRIRTKPLLLPVFRTQRDPIVDRIRRRLHVHRLARRFCTSPDNDLIRSEYRAHDLCPPRTNQARQSPVPRLAEAGSSRCRPCLSVTRFFDLQYHVSHLVVPLQIGDMYHRCLCPTMAVISSCLIRLRCLKRPDQFARLLIPRCGLSPGISPPYGVIRIG